MVFKQGLLAMGTQAATQTLKCSDAVDTALKARTRLHSAPSGTAAGAAAAAIAPNGSTCLSTYAEPVEHQPAVTSCIAASPPTFPVLPSLSQTS